MRRSRLADLSFLPFLFDHDRPASPKGSGSGITFSTKGSAASMRPTGMGFSKVTTCTVSPDLDRASLRVRARAVTWSQRCNCMTPLGSNGGDMTSSASEMRISGRHPGLAVPGASLLRNSALMVPPSEVIVPGGWITAFGVATPAPAGHRPRTANRHPRRYSQPPHTRRIEDCSRCLRPAGRASSIEASAECLRDQWCSCLPAASAPPNAPSGGSQARHSEGRPDAPMVAGHLTLGILLWDDCAG